MNAACSPSSKHFCLISWCILLKLRLFDECEVFVELFVLLRGKRSEMFMFLTMGGFVVPADLCSDALSRRFGKGTDAVWLSRLPERGVTVVCVSACRQVQIYERAKRPYMLYYMRIEVVDVARLYQVSFEWRICFFPRIAHNTLHFPRIYNLLNNGKREICMQNVRKALVTQNVFITKILHSQFITSGCRTHSSHF